MAKYKEIKKGMELSIFCIKSKSLWGLFVSNIWYLKIVRHIARCITCHFIWLIYNFSDHDLDVWEEIDVISTKHHVKYKSRTYHVNQNPSETNQQTIQTKNITEEIWWS